MQVASVYSNTVAFLHRGNLYVKLGLFNQMAYKLLIL